MDKHVSCRLGFSNTFIQAWMRGPAVMTIGVNPDGLLDDGFLGRCCDSVDEMANSLGEYLSDPDMLTEAEKARRNFAADRSRLCPGRPGDRDRRWRPQCLHPHCAGHKAALTNPLFA